MNSTIDNQYTQTKETQAALTPASALQMLKEGNDRFTAGRMISRNLHQQIEETTHGQFPFAAVLGCIDSRVPSELVFDQGIGDIFNVRIAGNFVNTDILGSLEFACKVAGSKVIVVLGHTSCGAVKGACDQVELGNLTAMLQQLKPAVDQVQGFEERSSANAGFVQAVADENVRQTLDNIRQRSQVLSEMEQNGEITLVGAMYHVSSGKVHFYEQNI